MTDAVISAPPRSTRPRTGSASRRLDVTSPEAQARVRRRYRAETRFKLYGVIALTVTTVFLVVLLADILTRGLPAFWQHSIVLDVPVKAETIDPDNKRAELAQQAEELRSQRRSWFVRQFLGPGPADRAPDPLQPIRAGDYFGLARQALYDAFPGVEGRLERRKLAGLLSSGAGDKLRDQVSADVGLIGKTVRTDLLLSANADLYLKGDGTPIETRPGRGVATPSGTTGTITILTSANDFAADLTRAKLALAKRVAALRAEADRLDRRDSVRPGRAHQGHACGGRRPAGARRSGQRRRAAGRQDAEPAGRHQRRAGQGRHPRRQQDFRPSDFAARIGGRGPARDAGRSSPM